MKAITNSKRVRRKNQVSNPVFHIITPRGAVICNSGPKAGKFIEVDLVSGYWVTYEDSEGERYRMCAFCDYRTSE